MILSSLEREDQPGLRRRKVKDSTPLIALLAGDHSRDCQIAPVFISVCL